MDIRIAVQSDVDSLAQLLWLNATPEQQAQQSADSFAADLDGWWSDNPSHKAFVAQIAGNALVGMAWLAILPRVPRPGITTRRSADIQSVFVVPEERGKGIGSALVRAASDHAFDLGVGHVTVHSGRKAVPVYERLGFASSRQMLLREFK